MAPTAHTSTTSLPSPCEDSGVEVVLDLQNPNALVVIAEMLGELAADLYLDGKLDLD